MQHLTSSSPSTAEDSFCKTTMSRREGIVSCIDVTIMDRSAHRALPSSYSKIFPAFGAGAAVTHAAGLGGKRFIDFCEPHACVIAFIPKHGSERTPTRIQDGLRLSGLGEGGGIHIADEDCTIAFDQPGAQFVQEILPAIRDLGVNRSRAKCVSRALRAGQLRLQVTVEPLGIERRQLRVTEGREALQAQVDSEARHRAVKDRVDRGFISLLARSLRTGDTHIQIPAAPTILTEVARTQFKVTQTKTVPQRQPASGEVHLSPSIADCSDFEGNPAQGAARAAALTPGQADFSMLSAPPRVFFGNLLHSLNGQAQGAIPARRPFKERPEVKSRQESTLPLKHFERQVVAVVEDNIYLTREARKPCGVLVLHPQMQYTNDSGSRTGHMYSIAPRTLQNTRESTVKNPKCAMRAPLSRSGLKAGVSRVRLR
jgi:hypothetical protein